MTALLVVLALAAAPAKRVDLPMPPPPGAGAKAAADKAPPVEKPISMAAPKLSSHNLEDRAVSFYTEQLAAQFVVEGMRVITAKEIAELVGLERQKQLLGCSEDSASCMAELANALGVETVLTGEVARVGKRYQLLLKILEAGSARVLALHIAKLDDEEALVDELSRAARKMTAELAKRMNRTLVRREADEVVTAAAASAAALPPDRSTAPAARSGGMKALWWIAVGAGVAAAGGGGYGLYVADTNFRALQSPPSRLTLDQAEQLRSRGQLSERLGFAGVGVGAVAIAGGVAMLLFGGDGAGAPPAVSMVPQSGGASVLVQGVFP